MIQAPVAGCEAEIDPANPIGALAEFYRAFNPRDLCLMEANWDPSDDAAMDNPLGRICSGWPDIRQVYARLFAGDGRVEVEFHDYRLSAFTEVFVAIGRERGQFTREDLRLGLAIRTNRMFRRGRPLASVPPSRLD